MDEILDTNWLNSLDQETVVLVPTRGLLTLLNEQYAAAKIAQGLSVWEAPQLLVWADYVRLLWQVNRAQVSTHTGAFSLISTQQSLLLWTHVIEKSRRQEQALTLLNVQQTVVAVQRSWRLMHDWQINLVALEQDHVADTEQLTQWMSDYQALLRKRGLIDEPLLLSALLEISDLKIPFSRLVWHAYDLITAAQRSLNSRAAELGVDIVTPEVDIASSASADYLSYPDTATEIRQTLISARQLLEQDENHTVNIVIPDLSLRLPQVRELAREVFYSPSSPLQVQQNNSVYRFSLGEPLSDWAAIETALSVIKLLQNRCTVIDLSFLLRNQFLAMTTQHRQQARAFDRWLKKQRLHTLLVDNLPTLYAQCLDDPHTPQGPAVETDDFHAKLLKLVALRDELDEKLQLAKVENQFAALSFNQWVGVFSQWLDAWGWHTNTAGIELNSVQHQLHDRWKSLLQDYAGLSLVQRQAGLKRSIDVLQQMSRDAMFLPKSANSPILISSLLEAIGRPVDTCFLTGMNDAFPPPPRSDAFVPMRLLQNTDNPDASAQSSFVQAQRVNQSLLSSAHTRVISYAMLSDQDRELVNRPSPLYRDCDFVAPIVEPEHADVIALEAYQDSYGPAWSEPGRARGGSRIFENQSNCAFKAFVNHQLGFDAEDEVEFGLDAMDRGNVVHYLLDLLWERLDSQNELLAKSDQEIDTLIEHVISLGLQHLEQKFSDDKFALLQHERYRLHRLLKRWLDFESRRPQNFTVLEREKSNLATFAGIKFKYIIDRLDVTDDGQTFVIDYKTGAVDRNDWLGERLRRPQLPLYAVALDDEKRTQVSGIALAKVDAVEPKFVELAIGNVFRKKDSYEELWLSNRPEWEGMFSELATQFLSGFAEVNPIDDKTCQYCELHAVCRISQLKQEA